MNSQKPLLRAWLLIKLIIVFRSLKIFLVANATLIKFRNVISSVFADLTWNPTLLPVITAAFSHKISVLTLKNCHIYPMVTWQKKIIFVDTYHSHTWHMPIVVIYLQYVISFRKSFKFWIFFTFSKELLKGVIVNFRNLSTQNIILG